MSHNRCGACREGLITHNPADPLCDRYGTAVGTTTSMPGTSPDRDDLGPIDPPTHLGARVIDRDGDVWATHDNRWGCLTTASAPQAWNDLRNVCGPLVVIGPPEADGVAAARERELTEAEHAQPDLHAVKIMLGVLTDDGVNVTGRQVLRAWSAAQVIIAHLIREGMTPAAARAANRPDRDALAAAIYAGGDEPEWLTTADGSPNDASYEHADRTLAAMPDAPESPQTAAAELSWRRSAWTNAQTTLARVADRMDEHAYDELATVLGDDWQTVEPAPTSQHEGEDDLSPHIPGETWAEHYGEPR